jgi:hypothetical protein
VWVCLGCLIGAGVRPESVTESCIGRQGECTCQFCGCEQDSSWFKHACVDSLPEVLRAKLGVEADR